MTFRLIFRVRVFSALHRCDFLCLWLLSTQSPSPIFRLPSFFFFGLSRIGQRSECGRGCGWLGVIVSHQQQRQQQQSSFSCSGLQVSVSICGYLCVRWVLGPFHLVFLIFSLSLSCCCLTGRTWQDAFCLLLLLLLPFGLMINRISFFLFVSCVSLGSSPLHSNTRSFHLHFLLHFSGVHTFFSVCVCVCGVRGWQKRGI